MFYRQDELKIGTLVGTDEMGNPYYENNLYFYGNFKTIINIQFVLYLFKLMNLF